MSIGQQDFGFDPKNPVILGKTNRFQFDIPDLLVSEVSSMEWILADLSPVETPTPTVLVTKTVGSGIALTDGAAGLEVLVTLDPVDTVLLPGADYFHRLDYVSTSSDQFESLRGRGRLTPRV